MVMPTPFERLLAEISEQSQRDPAMAFARMEGIFGKSLTDADVRRLGSLAAQIGGMALGRWEETIVLLRRCLEHPALEPKGDTERSLLRAVGVLAICAGKAEEATTAFQKGITSDADRCRASGLTAQILAGRGRIVEAFDHLKKARDLCTPLPPSDEVVGQTGFIALNLLGLAEQRLKRDQELALLAADTLAASLGRGDWRNRHQSLYQRSRAFVLAGKPGPALALVQHMMRLEKEHQAGPDERFFSALAAARAQVLRGQLKIATAARKACDNFLGKASPPLKQQAPELLAGLDQALLEAQAALVAAAG